jgi:hypothetical protein
MEGVTSGASSEVVEGVAGLEGLDDVGLHPTVANNRPASNGRNFVMVVLPERHLSSVPA